ncbi:MAG: hypothetical protein JWM21_937 [Acidobacteria bacterium]|nr:hypothetical protein [Acidobacteriota bacterium]
MDKSSERTDNQIADWSRGDSLSTIREPEDSLMGTLIAGRYLIKSKLGQGGFGVVYLALDQKMVSRPVVVKVVLEQAPGDEYSVRKFKQEIEALARVDHPSIVGIFDAGEMPDGKPYLVMQYVEGISLRAAIRSEGMEFGRAANIIRQVGRALTAAHRKEIYHRDLKPENVMLKGTSDGDEQVKVIDFGVAKVRNSITSLSTGKERAVGTIAYMSPEQLNVRKLTPASDVYSFGVMAYEMLTGRRPTNPESVFQLLEMQRAGVRVKPMDLRPSLPQAAQDAILKALSFEPEARHQKARDFGDEVSWALLGDPDRTRPQAVGLIDSQPGAAPSPRIDQDQRKIMPTLIVDPLESTKIKDPKKKRPYITGGVAATLLLVLIGVGARYVAKNRSRTTTPPGTATANAGPERCLAYWLVVQKIQNGKPLGEPFKSEGNHIYGNNWRFAFNVTAAQSGSLYLVNEGPGPGGQKVFNILFPTPRNASSQLAAEQTIQIDGNRFDEFKGIERLWIIWSEKPLPDLEVAFADAAKTRGVIENATEIDTIKGYLKLWDDTNQRPTILPFAEPKQTIVKGRAKTLVSLVELLHENQ